MKRKRTELGDKNDYDTILFFYEMILNFFLYLCFVILVIIKNNYLMFNFNYLKYEKKLLAM